MRCGIHYGPVSSRLNWTYEDAFSCGPLCACKSACAALIGHLCGHFPYHLVHSRLLSRWFDLLFDLHRYRCYTLLSNGDSSTLSLHQPTMIGSASCLRQPAPMVSQRKHNSAMKLLTRSYTSALTLVTIDSSEYSSVDTTGFQSIRRLFNTSWLCHMQAFRTRTGLLKSERKECQSVTRCYRLKIEAANQRSTTVPAVKLAETGWVPFKAIRFSPITERLSRRSHLRSLGCRRDAT